jgi:hypothetical protein
MPARCRKRRPRGPAAAAIEEFSMSTKLFHPDPFLRRVLVADAAVSAAAGVLMAPAAGPLGGLLGLPATVLGAAGLALLPYAAYLLWLAKQASVPRTAVWVPIVLNVVWAVDCALVGYVMAPSALGIGFLAAQALAVLLFAELEFIGLRRGAAVAV